MNRTSVLRLIGGLGALTSAFGLYSTVRLIQYGTSIIPGGSPVASWGISGFFAISFLVGVFLLFRRTPGDSRPTR
ncbi:hypothetical protein KBB96_05265 [Luteolibacter ambystomatis]|uniref:Uncharacterized protein n=1 Tax=Luteolibacter ambystomatis TaxID=2824561 RepID=A0A975PGJ2_9BACT|nr:hypothetical protein [Luteolibacter ambystomatis]QUE52301.1 hypothetical protein KBB96_05265 [Luteolibacter ambystomatis]